MTTRILPSFPAPLPGRTWLIALGLFSALSAIGGGVQLIISRGGSRFLPPLELLQYTPFSTFLVPGMLLALVVGGTSLAVVIAAWRRPAIAVDLAFLAGGTLTLWILCEVAMLREIHWLHGVYGGLGGLLVGFAIYGAVRSRVARHRWVVAVTLAEATGFLVPMSVGFLGSGGPGWAVYPSLVLAGAVEGWCLGCGQAWVMPVPVRRRRFAAWTALGAGLAWACAMLLVAVSEAELPAALVFGIVAVAAPLGVLAIGGAQYLELRHHARRAYRWISWTVLAWLVALPASLAAGPFVDESTPVWASMVLFGSGGMLMAYVMALITWQGARRLS